MSRKFASIIIPSWNGRALLEECINSIDYIGDSEIVVFDNGSSDGTELLVKSLGLKYLRSKVNLGFAGAIDAAAREVDSEYLIFLNNDVRVSKNWYIHLCTAVEKEKAKVVSGLIVDWEGSRLDFAGGIMTFDGHAFQRYYGFDLEKVVLPETGDNILFPCGANMIIDRRLYLLVGGFDKDYFAYFEDVDLGWRVNIYGERVVFSREAKVFHMSQASSKKLGLGERGALFERNAFWTVFKNYDSSLFDRMVNLAIFTFLHRLYFLKTKNNKNRSLIGKLLPFARNEDPRLYAQMKAKDMIFCNLKDLVSKRKFVQSLRSVQDSTIFEKFPLAVIPTYPGDSEFFSSDFFLSLLPETINFQFLELSSIMR